MTSRFLSFAALIVLAAPAVRADDYVLDSAHAAVSFQISHLGLSLTHGRFKEMKGSFSIDSTKPAASKFELVVKADSVDTDNAKRDEHLRSPDFFNAKQHPVVSFKSTSVKPAKDGYEVTGDLTLHGVTKPITVKLMGGKTAEFPKGITRTGYSTAFTIKRSEFGMDKALDAVGDDVEISVSFEGTRK
jgi:polyisoprenoid-binding protein YceI